MKRGPELKDNHVFISSCGGQVYHLIRMSGVDGLARALVHGSELGPPTGYVRAAANPFQW